MSIGRLGGATGTTLGSTRRKLQVTISEAITAGMAARQTDAETVLSRVIVARYARVADGWPLPVAYSQNAHIMAIVPGSAHGTLVRNFVFPNIGKTASIDPTLSTTKATIGARTRTGRRRQIATSFRPIGNPETRRSTRQERPQYIPDLSAASRLSRAYKRSA